MYIIQT